MRLDERAIRAREQIARFGYGPEWQRHADSLLDKLIAARIWLRSQPQKRRS